MLHVGQSTDVQVIIGEQINIHKTYFKVDTAHQQIDIKIK